MGAGLAELGAVASLVHSTTLCGVPTIFAARPGPPAAGLMFRVGRADETLADAGITHLVEHLAMFGRDGGEFHRNGATSDVVTQFGVVGEEPDVVSFLNHVSRTLRALPVERLDVEKGILRTEAMQRGSGAADFQRAERYGAAGPGVVPYGELGLHSIDAARVQAWADARFTRGNAVLWFTSDRILQGLELQFADGMRIDVPQWAEVHRPRPAFVRGADGGVLIDAVIERSPAAMMFCGVAQRMLFRALRLEGGHSYTADVDYEPLDADRARVTLFADALPHAYAAVAEGTVDVLQRLRAGDIEERDLQAARANADHSRRHFSTDVAAIPSLAFNLLTRTPIRHPDAVAEEAEAVTVADIATIAEAFWDDAIAQIPDGSLEHAGFEPAPRWSSEVVEGRRFPLYGEPQFGLTIGDAGASLHAPDGDVTVRFAECVAYLTLPDGARTLIGADGFRVVIEPSQYFGLDPETMAALDARVPQGITIALPPRAEEEIPLPRGKPMSWRGYRGWAGVLGALCLFVLMFVLPFAIAMSEVGDSSLRASGSVAWAIVAVLTPLTVLLFAGARRRRLWTAVTGER